jgi:hypothetical protein
MSTSQYNILTRRKHALSRIDGIGTLVNERGHSEKKTYRWMLNDDETN